MAASESTEAPRPKRKPSRRSRSAAPRNTADRDLIIKRSDDTVEIALLEHGRLAELHHEKLDTEVSVGDIFLGRIKKLNPGLNAGFVDIGHKKEAFLHYSDLGPQLRSMMKFVNGAINGTFKSSKLDNFKSEPDIDKSGLIAGIIKPKQELLFQVSKEPISTKGPRLEAVVNLPGRYVVMSPFGKGVNVSKKIDSPEERKRLKALVQSLRPAQFGVIVRTAAEGRDAEELMEDIQKLSQKWDDIFKQLHKAKAPTKLLSELDKTSGLLRDLLSDSFNRVVVDDAEMYQELRDFLVSIAPEKVDIVKLHSDQRDVFDANGVSRQIKASFGKTITVAAGAYLVIESTEAMHVVDVNSGGKAGRVHDEALLKVNIDCAYEIARQMRLRDMGGLVVIDFIDMKNPDHRLQLLSVMREAMALDRAQHSVLPLSKFGLMQITRQRVRPEIKISTAEVCPSCKGSGEVNPTELVVDDIERDLAKLLDSIPRAKLIIRLHPFVHAYLTRGFPSQQMRWLWRHQTWLRMEPVHEMGMTEYKFFDQSGEEIRLGTN